MIAIKSLKHILKIKKIILLLLLITLFNGVRAQEKEYNIEDYVSVRMLSSTGDDKFDIVIPTVLEVNDDIGILVKKRMSRIEYLLWNRINIDSLVTVLPDSIKATKGFVNEIRKAKFQEYFNKIIVPNNYSREVFSESEMMNVASKFFKVVEHVKNKYTRNTCVASIGFKRNRREIDVTLLEAIVFDAINSRKSNDVLFMEKEIEYRKLAIEEFENETANHKLMKIRNSVYESMKQDRELKKYLLKYIKDNQNNIPIKIAS